MKNAFVFRGLQVAVSVLAAALPLTAPAVTFTNDTLISVNNTNLDGQDIVVTNCTLIVDGAHAFNSVQLLGGSTLTHTFSANGQIENRFTIIGEPQVMSSTNLATL